MPVPHPQPIPILGVDFTSRPSRAKPITAARAVLDGGRLRVVRVDTLVDFPAFEALLRASPWVGGFDFPFGLPRRFVAAQRAGTSWAGVVDWAAAQGREGFCTLTHAAFTAARGDPEAKHRRVDRLSGSHSPLKTMDPVRRFAINPPVGLMFFEGAPRLRAAGVSLPGLHETGDPRIAVEAYPGLVVRHLGERYYKNDKPVHGLALRDARRRIVKAIAGGAPFGIAVDLGRATAADLVADASGDRLDAVLCALQAATAARAGAEGGYGVAACDPVEGWITGVPAPATT